MTILSTIIYFLISIIFFVGVDKYCSEIILNDLRFKIQSNPIFDLIFVQNTGAAFSIFEDSKLFLIIFSSIAFIWITFYTIKNIQKLSTTTVFWVSMLCAGIICNLHERIEYGYVRDYIKLNFIDFPVFNISDIFINIGVIAIVSIIIRKYKFI